MFPLTLVTRYEIVRPLLPPCVCVVPAPSTALLVPVRWVLRSIPVSPHQPVRRPTSTRGRGGALAVSLPRRTTAHRWAGRRPLNNIYTLEKVTGVISTATRKCYP
jgi:hypothetical protein